MNLHVDTSDYTEDRAPTLQDFEEAIAAQKLAVESADTFDRLMANPDFIAVVLNGFIKNETVRLSTLLTSGRTTPKTDEGAARDLRAIGVFQAFLNSRREQGIAARDALEGLEQERNELVDTMAVSE